MAQHSLASQNFQASSRELASASADFVEMRSHQHRLGPVLPVARAIPLLRVQVAAVDAIANAGTLLAGAGISLATLIRDRLFGRIRTARDDLLARLPKLQSQAQTA